MSDVAAYIWGVGLTAFGLCMTIFVIVVWRRGLRSLEWPQTTGVVRESRIMDMALFEPIPPTPVVRYEYEVGGIKYSSRTVAFGLTRAPSEYIKKYRVGFNVPVYYNPDKPKVSVLEPGRANVIVYLTIFGLILSIAGIALMLWGAMRD